MRESMKVPCDECSHDRICHEIIEDVWVCSDCEEIGRQIGFVVEDSKIEEKQYHAQEGEQERRRTKESIETEYKEFLKREAVVRREDQEPGLRGLGDYQEQV